LLLSTRRRGNSCGHSKTRLRFAHPRLIDQGDCGLPGSSAGLTAVGESAIRKQPFLKGESPHSFRKNYEWAKTSTLHALSYSGAEMFTRIFLDLCKG
jgi:hypothetical protein